MLPWLFKTGLKMLKTERLHMHVFRSTIGLGAMLFWFVAVSMMPIADAVALSFTTPLFATVGAAVFLGETIRVRRWAAMVVGLIGALIIVRPIGIDVSLGAGLVLLASACMAMSALSVKSLSRTETPSTIVLFMGLIMTPMSLVPALLNWSTPQPVDYLWFVALGLFATIAQIAMARAFASADVSAVLPFDFSRLIFAAILGYLFFAESPDIWTWLGAAIIFSAALYTAHRESHQTRLLSSVQATQPPASAKKGFTN
jgi:drug/metabolite transporter (DMT)-like permease